MKLLVVTQKVNKNDFNLGFFHEWLLRFAGRVEKLTVICLEKGEYRLPENVEVLSLGKNEHISHITYHISFFKKARYAMKFYDYIWKHRNEYDHVFVHMNPEYCILGGIFWRLWGKKVLLWYTHKAVNWRLRFGVMFANKVFTASKESFRLKSKKVEVVGHGILLDVFANQPENLQDLELSLLAVGRHSPTKDFETAIKAVHELKNNKNLPPIKFSIESERKHNEMPELYHRFHILIHTSRTGSMDKVVLEALAAGRIVITSSEAFVDLEKEGLVYAFPAGDYHALADKIVEVWKSGLTGKLPIQKNIDYVRQNHNLDNLIKKIIDFYA